MKIKKLLINCIVMLLSVSIAIFLCELLARVALNPSDYLSVEMVGDNILGAIPSPHADAGFDAWGFRNKKVPETADVVAVGDSHTFGNTARMVDSWPYVLGQLTNLRVYNMGMGGYGPNQYFYLSTTKAFQLKPRVVLWGLYMGDDFENAYSISYGLDHWAYLRQLPVQKVNANIWDPPAAKPGWSKNIRIWLSRHSVLYQIVFHASFSGRVQGEMQIRNAAKLYPGIANSLIVPKKNILEAFRPQSMLTRLDQKNPDVLEGMRITFELMQRMNDLCRKNNAQFVVVIIPTKEMVFSKYLEHNPNLSLGNVFDDLLVNEREARQKLLTFLNNSNIAYVDTLPALSGSVEHELYARTAADMHPGKNGYHVIAEAVAAAAKNGFAPASPQTAPQKSVKN